MCFIAATGRVDRFGNVHAVANLAEKLDAIVREAPYVTHVLLPAESNTVMSPTIGNARVIQVATVSEALDELFGQSDLNMLAVLEPEHAAERAIQHELEHRHGSASAIAQSLISSRDSWYLADWNALEVEVKARMVRAANFTHRGDAKTAATEYAIIDQRLGEVSDGSSSGELEYGLRGLLAAFRASTQIDLLENKAVSTCAELEQWMQGMPALARVAVLGSWSRALAAASQFEEAVAKADQQIAATQRLKKVHLSHGFQALCNQVAALLGLYESTRQPIALERADESLDRAHQLNQSLVDKAGKTGNQQYLDLWQCRYLSLSGDIERARSLLAKDSPGRFPTHHSMRFVAEALLRAGHLDDALTLLTTARDQINQRCGEFERLVLLTSSAVEATARIEQQVGGWETPATLFLDAFENYRPGLLSPPGAGTDARAVRDALRDGLRRIPY